MPGAPKEKVSNELSGAKRESQLLEGISLFSIFNQAIEPHLLLSLEGHILDVNPSGCLYLGIKKDDSWRYSIFDLLEEGDCEVFKEVLEDIEETRVGILDVRFRNEDFGVLTSELVYQCVESATGNVVYVRVHDLHVLRILDRLVEQKETSFKGAERLAKLGSWEYYPKEDQIIWSDEVFYIFGLPVSSQVPTFEEYVAKVHPDDVQRFSQVVQNAILQGESYTVKHRIIRADGSFRWVLGRGDIFLDDEGGMEKLYGTVQDITEEEEIRENMRKSEQRIRFHLDRSPLGYIEWNLGFEVVEWNEAAERIFGFTKQDAFAGKAHIIPEDEAEVINQLVADLLSDNGGTHSINTNLTKEGRRITVEWFNTTLKGEKGEVIGIGSIVQDITQRIEEKKLLESYAQDLEVAKEEAESAAKAKSEFLANMSHEIRTPMNGVIGMASILLDTELDEEQQDYVETIVNSGESLLAIINDILNLSKIEAGKIELELVAFNIREVLENTADLLAAKAAEKQIELVLFIAPDVPDEVLGDPTRVQQVLLNLMGNAIKFTDTGYVEVCLNVDQIDTFSSKLTFQVKDTGIGIAKEKQKRLFQAFTQVDASTSRKYGGTGLGLRISSQLAQLMGGDISVSSIEGVGSTFSFSSIVKHGQRTETSRQELEGMNVLLVEPNRKLQQMIGALLSELNCNWSAVTNKEEAHKALEKSKEIDVLLVERILKDGSGIEFAEKITTMGAGAPEVVLITQIIDRGEYGGVLGRLTKPIHLKSLYRTLKKVCILQK